MNATDALAESARNEVYLMVDGMERMIDTGCFIGRAGVRMASIKLDNGTWLEVPADADLIVSRIER
jgi:hypothetical protein